MALSEMREKKRGKIRAILTAAAAVLIAASFAPAKADEEKFYAGKTLTFIVGTSPGGGYDLYMRLLAEFMPRHIPGQPKVVVQNIANASGQGAANRVYAQAPKDGTVFAMCSAGIVLAEALDPAEVRYRSKEFGWVGTMTTMTDVLAVFKSTGVSRIEDAKKTPVVLGAMGSASALRLQPALVNALLGTRFNIVGGYAGGNEVNLAMDRGEVQGRTNQWDSWEAQRPQWIAEGKLNYLLQIGPKLRELPDVPALGELVKDPAQKAMVDLLEVLQWVGRSVYTTPGVPEARLAMLRRAFDATMADPEYIARTESMKLDRYTRSGEETQAYIEKIMTGSEGVAKEFRKAVGLN
jgi:tripartite-type tricarboxylate transporter receptor subunit TctC